MKATLLRTTEAERVTTDWGSLTWHAGRPQGNSTAMTVGMAVIKPGCGNPLHSHPNCSEVLVVLKGRISHVIEDGVEIEMGEGDTITLPATLPHKASNIGDEDAVLLIAFSSADRQMKLEEG
jgi:quercetin dioxygenase-like cupin family protein